MKRSKLSEKQIITMLNEAESGIAGGDLCRKYQISSATFYKLKAKYTGMSKVGQMSRPLDQKNKI